jgi:hypothetical protein
MFTSTPQTEVTRVADKLRNTVFHKPVIAFPGFYSPMVDIHPYRRPESSLPNWAEIVPLGWAVQSPDMNSKLIKLGIRDDLLRAFADGSALLGTSTRSELDLATKYIAEHYGIDVSERLALHAAIGWLEVWTVEEPSPDSSVFTSTQRGNR